MSQGQLFGDHGRPRLGRGPIFRSCRRCGGPFTVDRRSSRRQYCTKSCSQLDRLEERRKTTPRVEFVCEECGQTFTPHYRMFKTSYPHRFCSDACAKKARTLEPAERKRRERERGRRYQRTAKYGLVPGQYEDMLARQGNACALCMHSFGDETPHIDHDHETGQVRGLLCGDCNIGIGLLAKAIPVSAPHSFLADYVAGRVLFTPALRIVRGEGEK